MKEDGKISIIWSYSVFWEPSPVAWASRWDVYLQMDDPQIHWYSIVNSLVTVFLLSGTFAPVLVQKRLGRGARTRRNRFLYNIKF